MPWTKNDYPDSMKNLPKDVRDKAVEIANALLEEKHMDEGISIATAISRAKDWAANRGKKTQTQKSRTTDVKKHGNDWYVIPDDDGGWAIKKEGNKGVSKVFDKKQDAVSRAREEAREANASLTIQKRDGKIQKRVSYNPNRRAARQ